MTRLLAIVGLVLLPACGQTQGQFVEFPFEGAGTAPETFVKDGWEVTLSNATLGLGSIYFCATESPSPDRCAVAIGEYLEGSTLDGLDPSSQPIGIVQGTTGIIRRSFFNYGIVWLLTSTFPEALAGVPGGPTEVRFEASNYVPFGHSAQFAGEATCVADPATCCPDADVCPPEYAFEANVDVLPQTRGDTTGTTETFQEITTDPRLLTVTFDPNAWWQSVDFGRLAALDDGTGTVVVMQDDPDYSALIRSMTLNDVPTLTWTTTEGAD
jgi:hypothetical protein